MPLLEREAALAALAERLDAARGGASTLALISGEAGIGKTALVRQFCDEARGARVLLGACDPLVTPRPLGPVLDMSERLQSEISQPPTSEASREALFRGFLDELSSRSWVTLAVIEDAHWADEATLDLIRFVGRRLHGIRALVAVTFRDDELGPAHPLRVVIGDLATAPGVVRVALPALSPEAVAALADVAGRRDAIDARQLHRQTAGNPFFVTEVLASEGAIPPSVRDAVLARASRLPPGARAVVDAAAVAPTRMETWVALALSGATEADLDDCVASGVLRADNPDAVAFRHELAREAIEASLLPARRTALHRRTAALLLDRYGDAVDPARIAHHAEQAGDSDLACRHAAGAARAAAAVGAHREAAVQYERALRHAEGLPPAQLAELLESYAKETGSTDRMTQALAAASRAVELRRALGDARSLGVALHRRAGAMWSAGASAEALATALEAVQVLESLEPGAELADAYAFMATHAMLSRDYPATLHWGARAISLAERLGDRRPLAQALNSVGSAKLINGDQTGAEDLRRSIALASESELDSLVAIGWSNLGSASGEVRDYGTAEAALREAIAFTAARDLDANMHYSAAWLARVRFEVGDWGDAEALAAGLPLDSPQISPITKIVAMTVLGRLAARRGLPDPWEHLDHAWALASRTGDLQRLWPVAAARAEAAWLAGDFVAISEMVTEPLNLAIALGHGWAAGELALWLWRATGSVPDGALEQLEGGAGGPYSLQIRGDVEAAAAVWTQIGCPYEAADARSDSDDPSQLRRALDELDRLGAAAAALRVRRRLRELGERSIPRGPRAATSSHPAGLTPRQAEVLELVGLGLTDAEIAARLFISRKTAGHHVSAILDKLGADSRAQAAHRARALGLAPADGEPGAPT